MVGGVLGLQCQGLGDQPVGRFEIAAGELDRAQQVPGVGIPVILADQTGIYLCGPKQVSRLLQRNPVADRLPRPLCCDERHNGGILANYDE